MIQVPPPAGAVAMDRGLSWTEDCQGGVMGSSRMRRFSCAHEK